MMIRLFTWLASLRVRLTVTYVLVTALSFGFVLLLLLEPMKGFMMQREQDQLTDLATTLGTTIRSPVESSMDSYLLDLYWTQRRCVLYLCEKIPDTRFRVLDPHGREQNNSDYPDWGRWWNVQRMARPALYARTEVRNAIASRALRTDVRPADDRKGAPMTMYIALPVYRTDKATGSRRLAFLMYLDRPVDSVNNDLRELRQRIMLSMVTSLLITMLVSILLAGNVASGLQSATRIARAFAAGHTDLRMRDSGRDEVGQLGAAFNQMADALQRQEQLRRNLLADVSHELRTPLTAIAGCADTLSDGALGDDPAAAERFLGIIVRESERLQRLVADILVLSKLQAGTVEIPRQPLPIGPLIADAVELARLHARQEQITIIWTPPAEVATLVIQGNEDRLAQALRNLLDNARHHTPEGKTITVSVDTEAKDICLRIHDEGDGIPPEDLPWVFDRFYRAGKGSGKPGGTGLGLAIVREIIHAHDGRVTVESTMGIGTTFSLHLPRAHTDPPDDSPTARPAVE